MSENTHNVIVNLVGNLTRNAQRYSQSLGRFASQGRRHMAGLERNIVRVDRQINRLGNRWITLGSGGVVAVAATAIVNFDAELTQLGVDAEISDKKLAGLKNQIHSIANASNIRVNRNNLLAGVKEITARTGEVGIAIDNLENIGLLMRATGATAVDSAALIANYYEKFNIKNAQDMLRVLSESAVLGKQGAFELRDLATEGNSVTAAYAATGRVGPKAIREMNTMLQIIRRTTPSAAEAATSFERLIATITAEKVDVFKEAGIKIWDQEELKKGNKIARAVPDIILDILKVSGGDQEKLAKVFDIRALRAINAFADEYRKTGRVDTINQLMSVSDSGAQLFNDASRNAKTFKFAINNVTNSMMEFADTNLSKPIQDLALWIDKLEPEKLQEMLETTKQWVVVLGSAYLGLKSLSLAARVKSAFGRKGETQSVTDLMGSTPATPMFVYVVNNGLPNPSKTGPALGKKGTGRALGLAKNAVRFAGPLAAGYVSYQAATALGADKLLAGTKTGDDVGRFIASFLAALGNENAKRALKNDPENQNKFDTRNRARNRMREENVRSEPARVEIEVKGDTSRVNIRSRRRRKAPEVVVTGSTMGTF